LKEEEVGSNRQNSISNLGAGEMNRKKSRKRLEDAKPLGERERSVENLPGRKQKEAWDNLVIKE